MHERDLRRDIAAYAEAGIPDQSDQTQPILARVAGDADARQRRPWRLRLRVGLAAAVVLATLTAAGAAAVASGTFPVRFNVIEPGRPQDKVAASIDPKEQAAIEAKKRIDEADRQAQGSADDKKGGVNGGTNGKTEPAEMSLADAQAKFGARVLLPAGLQPTSVHYLETFGMFQRTKPGVQPPADTVELKFTAPIGSVTVFEERDPSTDPLSVDVLNQDGPVMKTDGGLGRAAIETVAGGSYVVGYTVDGTRVATVVFKSSSGVAVTIHFETGVDHDAALSFATSLE